eukprot:scaffold1768_cov116-Isochrysis_galbana.AAC.9
MRGTVKRHLIKTKRGELAIAIRAATATRTKPLLPGLWACGRRLYAAYVPHKALCRLCFVGNSWLSCAACAVRSPSPHATCGKCTTTTSTTSEPNE